MTTLRQICFAFVLICVLLSMAAAQERSSVVAQGASLTITAAATDERVRITAPSSVVQMHLEVYAATGEKLFDQEIRGGNVFDWHLQDGQGQRLAAGPYVCVVTAKSISGKLIQKIGTVSVEEKSVSVQPAASPQLSLQQTQVIGPVEDNSSWTIPGKDEPQTPTVIANDGTDGQMIRGRGALTFRIGNFFTGSDTEQMRLTEAGNLGIGTSDPRSRLDVAGTIRAERFLMAKPKSNGVDKTATENPTTDSGDFQPLIMGTGTQDRIAKWTDGAGTLGDSGITETAGLVGIGTTTPDSKLVVSSNSATLPPATSIARFAAADGVQTAVFADAFGTNPLFNVRRANGTAASPSAVQANQLLGVIGASGYGASAYVGTRARVGFFASENWTNTANGTYLTFNTTANGAATAGGAERMRIDNAGNVGIGTPTPTAGIKLDVNGSVLINPTGVAGNPLIQFGTPNAETGMSIVRSTGLIGRADVRFNGSTLSLLAGTGNTAPCCGVTINTNGGVSTGTYSATAAPSNGMIISGNVGIGTTTPAYKLQVAGDASFSGPVGIGVTAETGVGLFVRGPGTTSDTVGLSVGNSSGLVTLQVLDDGRVEIFTLDTPSTVHACYRDAGNKYFSACNSAAEYVPTIDDGGGFPQTADLVSIAPSVKSPYSDDHAPFVVTKAAKSCDDNLIGFIVNPDSGADGKKVNEHYLPLAIYGYFPAKVTTENGAIKRGDPITSSSKAGYGMKATQACKIIGYALEDAITEGTIQVFAHQSESSAPQVAALRAQLQGLRRENSTQMAALQTQSAKLQSRLNALEQTVQRSTENSSLVTTRRSESRGTKLKSTHTASRRSVHSRAIAKSRTVSSGL